MNAPQHPVPVLERATGRLDLRVRRAGGRSGLAHLLQDGCLKARFPAAVGNGPKRGVLINTTGGIADGDDLATRIQVGKGAALALTTQAAERIYRARDIGSPARIDTAFDVAPDGTLYWLPQETILFEGAAVHRRYKLDVAAGGQFLGAEMVVLGRTAMAEHVMRADLFDRWRIHVDGRLLYADGFRLEGDLEAAGQGAAQLAGAVAYAGLFYVGSKAADVQGAIRALFDSATDQTRGITCGTSVRTHPQATAASVMIARFAATDSKPLRALLADTITVADKAISGDDSATHAILSRWIF